MFKTRLINIFNFAYKIVTPRFVSKIPKVLPVTLCMMTVNCEPNEHNKVSWNESILEHDFLIRQATTVNVNASTQLLTVILVAIQDTSERLRDGLTKEIALVQQAMEWGEDGTPPQHWDQLVAIKGSLCDLNHNLRMLYGYMEYAEKIATVAAEISYLSGNVVASDAICERIDHATRVCKIQKQLNHELQQESLELQQKAIISVPQMEDKLKTDPVNNNTTLI